MSQNSLRMSWTRDGVDAQLEGIMKLIHRTAAQTAREYGREGDYVFGQLSCLMRHLIRPEIDPLDLDPNFFANSALPNPPLQGFRALCNQVVTLSWCRQGRMLQAFSRSPRR